MAEVTNNTTSYDYSNIGSFGSEATQSLSGETINKVRAAEEKAVLNPIVEDLENLDLESEMAAELQTKIDTFLDTIKPFDLFSSSNNAFEQISASTTGSGAIFDAADVGSLEEGTYIVEVSQLAQRDVYQSKTITDPTTEKPTGTFQIVIDGEIVFGTDSNSDGSFDSPMTLGTGAGESDLTYSELVEQINDQEGLIASLEQVSDNNYRIVVKSANEGTANSLTFSGTNDIGFIDNKDTKFTSSVTNTVFGAGAVNGSIEINGITFDNGGVDYADLDALVADINGNENLSANIVGDYIEITDANGGEVTIANNTLNNGSGVDLTFASSETKNFNHIQEAQNLNATVDGISYDVSSNSISVGGNLKVTATEPNSTTTLTITQDDSAIVPALKDMAEAYNEIVALITEQIYGSDSPVEDTSSLRDILSGLKNMFFGEYGENDLSAINMGLEFDKFGLLTVNEDTIGEALTSNYDGVKDFFLGVAEDKGFGTLMKEYLDEMNSFDGIFTNYQESILDRKTTLEEEKEEEIDRLDTKYATMAAQFTAYASIIAQMEASFGGLQMMIAQSQAK